MSALDAQSGSATGLSGGEANASAPPNPLPAIGLPDSCGVSTAVMACAGSSTARAIRFTSSTVTAW